MQTLPAASENMKLVSVLLARSVWLFDFTEFNPKGLNLWPAFEFLTSKYHFASTPKNILDVDEEKALAFKAGNFVNSKGDNVLVSLKIFNNGITAEASSTTDDSDEFLQQAAGLVAKEFALSLPPKVGRAYLSQLEVETEFPLRSLNPGLAQFADLLSSSVSTFDGKPRQFDFGVLQLWTSDVNPATSPAYFRFERRLGLPFASNRYFSQAALKTKEHLEFLGKLKIVLVESRRGA